MHLRGIKYFSSRMLGDNNFERNLNTFKRTLRYSNHLYLEKKKRDMPSLLLGGSVFYCRGWGDETLGLFCSTYLIHRKENP